MRSRESEYDIKVFNRYINSVITEKVYGSRLINWQYTSFWGRLFLSLIKSKLVSNLYGLLQDTSFSKRKIKKFIKDFDIKIDEYRDGNHLDSFKSFNDFFTREFLPKKRSFPDRPSELGAFAEGRYLGFLNTSDKQLFNVKGSSYKTCDLLNNEKWCSHFREGNVIICRLAPVDYHRFHYPDNGVVIDRYRIPGSLYSVNPIAMDACKQIFSKNERIVSIIETENFGYLAYIEVGATMVGRIVQTHDINNRFKRGDEKGYFKFGGSTVIVISEKDRLVISSDILDHTEKGVETFIRLGDTVAFSP